MKKADNSKRYVLITGASSGFGTEFARVFGRRGYPLFLTGRDQKRLISIAKEIRDSYGVDVRTMRIDLTTPDAGGKLFKWVKLQNVRLYCLVNNAGIGNYGKFADNSLAKERELVELNIGIVTELCHRSIPVMLKAGGGKILNVASLAAFQPGPFYATYYASKAFVLCLTEALALEYRKENISFSALCPGPSPTRFFERALMIPTKFLKLQFMHPQKVAEIGYKGLMEDKIIIIPGVKNRIVPLGSRLLPRPVVAYISKKFVEWSAKK